MTNPNPQIEIEADCGEREEFWKESEDYEAFDIQYDVHRRMMDNLGEVARRLPAEFLEMLENCEQAMLEEFPPMEDEPEKDDELLNMQLEGWGECWLAQYD